MTLFAYVHECNSADEDKTFTVMTFNTWITGSLVKNGLYKISSHIKSVDPDIVALQVSSFSLKNSTIYEFNNICNKKEQKSVF